MELTVQKRDSKANTAALRRAGILPAVMYGRSQESMPISLDRKAFEKVFAAAGESTVITLTGFGDEKEALINDVVADPLTGIMVHADLYVIQKGQKVTVSVPLEFTGVSPAVKDSGAILVKVMHEIEMEILPKELPHSIIVDISKLVHIDDKILVSDLAIPPSATINVDADEVVAMASKVEEEKEESSAPVDLSAIEVEKKGKKEEEEVPAAE